LIVCDTDANYAHDRARVDNNRRQAEIAHLLQDLTNVGWVCTERLDVLLGVLDRMPDARRNEPHDWRWLCQILLTHDPEQFVQAKVISQPPVRDNTNADKRAEVRHQRLDPREL